MAALIDVILPVFLVIGFGYVAAWKGYFSQSAVEGLMRFAQSFAVPCLLFSAISKIDLSADFDIPLLASFYGGAFSGFTLGFIGARHLFARNIQDSIAIGFCCLFSNSVLLGLPITQRAYGPDALNGNYAIISVHALIIYAFGVTLMEISRSGGAVSKAGLARKILISFSRNPLLIAIFLGFVVNLGHIPLPGAVNAGVDMMVRAALPAALFALGGTLTRYRPEGDMKTIAWISGVSLIVHPAVTYSLGTWVFDLSQTQLRSAVVTAAMAPGVNSYLFANMYGTARRVAASSVLIATALSILTVWVWLIILP